MIARRTRLYPRVWRIAPGRRLSFVSTLLRFDPTKTAMEIRDTKPVSRAAPLRKAAAPSAATGAAAPAAVEEAVSLAGVPESEMTPRVRQALMGLLGEVDRLRRELDDSRNRIAFLERLADEDSLMPI